MMFDYNGDGKDDMLIISYISNPIGTPVSFDLYMSNGNGFNPPTRMYIAVVPGPDASIMKVVPGDFDGDGKKEILILNPINQLGNFYDCEIIGDEYPPVNIFTGNFLGLIPLPIGTANAIDFNGDGKDDLLRLYDSQTGNDCEVQQINFTYDPVTGKPTPVNLSVLSSTGLPFHDAKVFTGDFNGDGKTDMLSWWSLQPLIIGNGIWTIHYSHGDAFDANTLPAPLSGLAPAGPSGSYLTCDYDYYVSDFNGDGKSDIIELHAMGHNPTDPTDYKIFYSHGNNEFTMETGTLAGVNAYWDRFDVGDFNGDGQADLLVHQYPSAANRIIYFHKNQIKHLVTSILHAGHRIEVETLPLLQDPDYSSTVSVSYPFNSVPLALKVVKQVKDICGSMSTGAYYLAMTTTGALSKYIYKDIIQERTGLGLRGFQTFIENNDIAQISNKTTFDLTNFPTGLPIKTEKSTYSNQPVAQTDMTYAAYDGGANGASHIVVPLTTINQDFFNNFTNTDVYTYNSILPGGTLYEIGKSDKVTHTEGTDLTIVREPQYDLNAIFINKSKPIFVTTTNTYGAKPPFVQTADFQYDALGNLIKEREAPNTANERTTTYLYGGFWGNMLHKEWSAVEGNLGPFAQDNVSAADGRFFQQSSNTLGYTNYYQYDIWGNITSVTTADGLTTTYTYDCLNRQTQMHSPNGAVTTTTYEISGGPYTPLSLGLTRFMTTVTNNADGGFKKTYFDCYDRPVRNVTTSFNDILYEDMFYYSNGLLEAQTKPYKYTGAYDEKTTYTYDDIGRPLTSFLNGTVNGPLMQTSYNVVPAGLEKTVTNTNTGQSKITKISKSSRALTVIDNTNNIIDYDYNSNGKPDAVTLNGDPNFATTYQYDAMGRTISVTEPNAGTTSYEYNGMDNLVKQTDANSTVYTFVYDNLGREIKKTGPEGNYITTYNNTLNVPQTGKITSIVGANNIVKAYTYNALGLVATLQEGLGANTFITQYTYDAYARLDKITYPSNHIIRHVYNSYGELKEIDRTDAGFVKLWEATEKNELGQLTKAQYNNGMYKLEKTYTPIGSLTQRDVTNMISTNLVASQSLDFDPASGNLVRRIDQLHGWQEDFHYDSYDRLTQVNYQNNITMATLPDLNMSYGNEGNILKKSDVTGSTYNWKYSKYALTQVPQPPHPPTAPLVIPLTQQDVTYTPFKMVQTIVEGTKNMKFAYGATGERFAAQYFTNTTLNRTRFYASNYERTVDAATGNQKNINYIWAGDELVAMLIDNNTGVHTVYPLTDHLGSITHILDDQGTVNNGLLEERSFDAWGRMRNPVTYAYLTTPPTLLCDRGYTGHEHLGDFNIINMNGRLYDPFTGRMYSADPVLTDRTMSQAYNKYSYVMNNPLKHTDPSGKFIPAVAFAAAVVGAMIAGCAADYRGGNFWNAAAIGFFSSVAGGVAGSAVSLGSSVAAGAASGAAGGAAAGFVGATLTSFASGNSFGEVMLDGLKGAAAGGVTGAFVGGLTQGLSNIESNRNFWTGAPRMGGQATTSLEGITNRQSYALRDQYNRSYAADQNDKILADKVRKSGVRTYGKFGTKLPEDIHWGLDTKGNIRYWYDFGNRSEVLSAATLTTSSGEITTFVSPNAISNFSDNTFTGLLIHESVHAFHLGVFGNSYNRLASEQAAYMAEANYFASRADFSNFGNTITNQKIANFTGAPPAEYTIPPSFR